MDIPIVGQRPEIELKRFRRLKENKTKKRKKQSGIATSCRVIAAEGKTSERR